MIVKGKYIIISGVGPGLGTKLAVHAALEGAAGIAIGGLEPEKIVETRDAAREALKMSHAVLPQMRKQKEGAIVMICTMGTKMVPLVDQAGYNASKAALFNATRALAKGVGKDNIRVNSLHPGFMWGKPVIAALPVFAANWGGEEAAKAKIIAHNALPRIVTDDEAARAGLFLASDYASGITGATLDVNGGAFMP